MEASLLAAKVLGIYLIVSGFFLIARGKTVPHLLKDFFGHPAIVYLTGIILIFLSALFLLEHNVWDGSWRTITTVFAWLVLLKGLAYLFAPEMLRKMANKEVFESTGSFGIVSIAVGLSLFFLA